MYWVLGWSSGLKLKFFPINPGLTPAQVNPKKDQKSSVMNEFARSSRKNVNILMLEKDFLLIL